jgi:glycosyltransferase involved in cell wall biosynthesis
VSPDKIIEIPSGVEESSVVSQVRPAGKKRNFVFLGRYERRKGIEELNKAIKMCSPEVLAISEFHFIGPIPEHKKLSSNAVYHGEIRDKEKLKGLLAKADVLLCPSWSEGMPNVILEGMSNGLAVIATDVGATNIMVDERTGWLIDSPEPPQIRKAIEAAATCADTELNTRKFNALQKVRENFTWEQIIQKFIAVLNALKGS